MLLRLGRILETSTATNTATWIRDERHSNIEAMPPLKRKVAGAVLDFSNTHPTAANSLLDGVALTRGLRYLGAGVEFSAYKNTTSPHVVKVHRRSAGITEAERVLLVADKEIGHKLLEKHLGNTTLPQTVIIAEHPLGGGRRTVQILQPFVNFGHGDAPFQVNHSGVDLPGLERLVRRLPGIDVSFREFIDRSRIMFEDVEQLPDTDGTNNVVAQPNGSLVLLDSTPIGTESQVTQRLILDQLTSLEEGLLEVA